MDFQMQFNKYLKELNITSKEFSMESGLSETVISRYRNGERVPKINSMQLSILSKTIYKLSIKNGIEITEAKILNSLEKSLQKDNMYDYKVFIQNFNDLIENLNININNMSKQIPIDSSYIYRIKNGKKTPLKLNLFIDKICNYIIETYSDDEGKRSVSILLDCNINTLSDNDSYFNELKKWITSKHNHPKNYVGEFLKHLNEFNLNDYIKSIKFDELKVPSIPFYKPKNKTYYGIEEMKKGELDFFKGAVLSKLSKDIFMCSDMPMADMAKDIDFGKKWMFAIAMSIKKGLHINIIHNINRPFNEMMLGLESWIPIYMTGQVSPFYLPDYSDKIYCHFNYVSEAVGLTGECINGFHNDGKYYLTNNKQEIEYLKKKSNLLLKKAEPLMEIYTENESKKYKEFLIKSYEKKCNITRTLTALPLFTLTDKLLTPILKRNKVSSKDIEKIIEYKRNQYNNIKNNLVKHIVTDKFTKYNKENFAKDSIYIDLDDIFFEKKILYNFEEYSEHLQLTKNFEKNNNNYKIQFLNEETFKNIKIASYQNNFVIISKSSNPNIHFVIKHPKLRDAIDNFIVPVKE